VTNEADSRPKILIIDDSKVIRWAATKILDKDHTVLEASNGEEGWEILQNDSSIGVVFTDLQMPVMDGYQLLEKIRTSDEPGLMNMPVVVITSQEDDEGARERILDRGATDFISKPFDSLTLKSRASAYLSYGRQVAELEEQVEQDKLTGLANKRFFFAHGEKSLALASRHETSLTIALIEIDRFGGIIEKFGKKVAAQLLVKVSQQLTQDLRKEDLAARIETARLALILPLTNRIGGLRAVARLCQQIAALNLKVGGQPIALNISAGISTPDGQPEAEFASLVQQAETALATATTAGSNCIVSASEGVPHQLDEITTEFIEAEAAAEAAAEEAAAPAAAEAPEAATEAPSEISLEAGLRQIAAGEGGQLSSEQLAGLLRAVMPLIEQANNQLGLGLNDALQGIASRLEETTGAN
jgi:diguanylate cyclase (GGDEF)-like protein